MKLGLKNYYTLVYNNFDSTTATNIILDNSIFEISNKKWGYSVISDAHCDTEIYQFWQPFSGLDCHVQRNPWQARVYLYQGFHLNKKRIDLSYKQI